MIALVGPPNAGKTTLFNALSGRRARVVNYPGSTVDLTEAELDGARWGVASHETVIVVDTPGVYSLSARSPDEVITTELIEKHPRLGRPRALIAVCDATQLSRHLLVPLQLCEKRRPLVVALTMNDLLGEAKIDCRELSLQLGVPVFAVDGRSGQGVRELVQEALVVADRKATAPAEVSLPPEASVERAAEIAERVLLTKAKPIRGRAGAGLQARLRRDRIDAWLLHPVFGVLFFGALMSLLFGSVFWAAAPLMDGVEVLFQWVGEGVQFLLGESLLSSLLTDGVIGGFSAVLVFVPQIFILFIFISILEDSGYLGRAAVIVDRPLSAIGLGGRSFVPLFSGFACAVPAMLAARSIPSRRERLLTLFILPLMSCSARLPVYALLLGLIFTGSDAWIAGLGLTALYLASLFMGALAARIAAPYFPKEDSYLMLELPVYRRPLVRQVLRQAFLRTKNYVRKAGPVILVLSVVMWAGTTFPRGETLENSYVGRLGHIMEPVFEPMGGDGRTGIALITAFAAREVFVSSLAVIFAGERAVHGKADATATTAELSQRLKEARHWRTGLPIFTLSSVLGLLLFFLVALQCLSTVSVSARESESWSFALFQLAVFNVAAYLMAVGLVQGLRFLGLP